MKFKCEAWSYLDYDTFLIIVYLKIIFILKNYFLHFKLLFLINLIHKLVDSTITEAAITLTDVRQKLFQGIPRPPKLHVACIWLYI